MAKKSLKPQTNKKKIQMSFKDRDDAHYCKTGQSMLTGPLFSPTVVEYL